MSHPASTYRQFSVQGSTPLGLVVMLYDGAIAAIRQAVTAIEVGDIARKCLHLNRASAIIAQLEGTLNFTQGGEVARTLKSLYVYTRGQLLKGNLENSAEILRAVIDKLSTVREAWHEADHRPPATAPETSEAADSSSAVPSLEAAPSPPPRAPVRAAGGNPYASSPGREPGSWRVSA